MFKGSQNPDDVPPFSPPPLFFLVTASHFSREKIKCVNQSESNEHHVRIQNANPAIAAVGRMPN